MSHINYDILACILDYLEHDKVALCECALVNRIFAEVASRVLYRRVVLFYPWILKIDYRRKDDLIVRRLDGILYAACLPHNAANVIYVEISGYLNKASLHLDLFDGRFPAAMKCWRNLSTLVLRPIRYSVDVFSNVLPILGECSFLRNLAINGSSTDAVRAPMVTKMNNLDNLTIDNPTRAILQLLPDWLGRLSASLRGLYLLDNCGSITPGVLRSLAPHLGQIQGFALGLSYSLTDNDVFAFLTELPYLKHLDLHYYWQLRTPSVAPRLYHLRSLTVRHSTIDTVEHAAYLCKWIRRVVACAPLVDLRLVGEENRGASVNFDSLLASLTQKQAKTLRVLRMDTALVRRDALREFCTRCGGLEELAIAISGKLLADLPEIISSLHHLRTIRIETRNMKRKRILMDSKKALDFMQRGPRCLRRLSINGTFWEGQWVPNERREVDFVVKQLEEWQVQTWDQRQDP